MNVSSNTFLISLLMFVMTFLSYFLIAKVPLYIFILAFILITLLFNKNIKLEYTKREFLFYLYIIFFTLLISYQFLMIEKIALLFSLASFLSGLGIVIAVRSSIVTIKSTLFIVEVFIIFQALIGLIAIVQAFTGQLYPSHFYMDSHTLSGLWNRPSGIEGMTYNFGKNYIFPTVFIFVALKYELYKYSTFFTKKNLQIFLAYFIFIIVISKTRSTQLALFSLYFFYFIYTRKLYKLKYIVFGISLVLIIFLFVATHLDLFLDTSSKTRFILWYAGFQMFLSNPFTGVGIGLFGDYYDNTSINLDWIGDDYDHRVNAPHNIILSLLSGGGLIGIFIFISAFYKLLKYIKNYHFNNIELKIIAISIYYYFIAYFIDFQFHNYWNDNYYWFWSGLALAVINIDKKQNIKVEK